MPAQTTILLLIPCYNCDDNIADVIRRLTPASLARLSEVLVIDNGSQDNTVRNAVDAAREHGPGTIKVLLNDANYGLGGTHKVAIDYGRRKGYDYLAVLHGDGQAASEELDDVIAALDASAGADAVLGCRFMKASRIRGYSKLRTAGNKFFNLVYSVLTGRRIYDLGSGLNIFSLKSLDTINLEKLSDVCDFNYCLLLAMIEKNMRFINVPISWSESGQRSNVTTWGIGLKCLKTVWNWRIGALFPGMIPVRDYSRRRTYTINDYSGASRPLEEPLGKK